MQTVLLRYGNYTKINLGLICVRIFGTSKWFYLETTVRYFLLYLKNNNKNNNTNNDNNNNNNKNNNNNNNNNDNNVDSSEKK